MVVVDDSISTFANLDLLHRPCGYAYVLCSSLAKLFSGAGNVMASSMVLNTASPYAAARRDTMSGLHLEPLYSRDAAVLEINSRSTSPQTTPYIYYFLAPFKTLTTHDLRLQPLAQHISPSAARR